MKHVKDLRKSVSNLISRLEVVREELHSIQRVLEEREPKEARDKEYGKKE